MAQKLLHGADVSTCLQQVRGKTVAQGVDRDWLGNTRLSHRQLKRPLHTVFVQMMSPLDATARVYRQRG